MKKNIGLLLLLLFAAVSFYTCGEEPIQGCTNEEAENCNPVAEENDGNCIFARDKFIGEFSGTLLCGTPLPPMAEFTMVISEGLSGNNDVQIEFKDTDNPLPILDGTAEGNLITVQEASYQIALNPDAPEITTEVLMSGTAEISEDGNSITGTISATVVPFPIPVTCTFTATR